MNKPPAFLADLPFSWVEMQNKTLLIVMLFALVVIFFTAIADWRVVTESAFDSSFDSAVDSQDKPSNSGSNTGQSQPEFPLTSDIDFYRQLSPRTVLQLQLDNQGDLALRANGPEKVRFFISRLFP